MSARDEWADLLAGTDACVAPVPPPTEAARHSQLADRNAFYIREEVTEASPAPRSAEMPPAPEPATGAIAPIEDAVLARATKTAEERGL